jgi:enoyl-CoA hydratase
LICDFLCDGAIAWLTLSEPTKRNALNQSTITALAKQLDILQERQQTHIVVLSGAGGTFAAGVDLTEVAPMTPEQALSQDYLGSLWHRLARFPLPTIAAIEGYALGGGFELALMCDLLIATDTAQFGFPEVSHGLLPGLGGTQKLTRLIGRYRTAELCFTGRFISAQEALTMGLLNRVVPQTTLKDAAIDLAQTIIRQPQSSLYLIKKAINYSTEAPLAASLELERQLFFTALATHEKRDRTKRFLHKQDKKDVTRK